jgi:hypothetical protein
MEPDNSCLQCTVLRTLKTVQAAEKTPPKWKCTICHTENGHGTNVCSNCRNLRIPDVTVPTKATAPVPLARTEVPTNAPQKDQSSPKQHIVSAKSMLPALHEKEERVGNALIAAVKTLPLPICKNVYV